MRGVFGEGLRRCHRHRASHARPDDDDALTPAEGVTQEVVDVGELPGDAGDESFEVAFRHSSPPAREFARSRVSCLALGCLHPLPHVLHPWLPPARRRRAAGQPAEQQRDVRRADQDRHGERSGATSNGCPDPGVVVLHVLDDRLDLHAHRQEHRALEDEPTVRQFHVSDSRFCGERSRGAPIPVTRPATTAATRPEAPSSAAGTDATNGTVNEMTVFTVGVGHAARERARLSRPTAQPMATATTTE